MPSESVTLCAVGDIAAFHDESVPMFEHVSDLLADADIRFAQNERHYNQSTATPVGGFTEQLPPKGAEVLRDGGFDVISFASNHCMDLGAEGMLETVGTLRKQGFTVIGSGANLQEARRPAVIERNGLKVAFLAYCSVLRPGYQAEAEKPGAAPMRAHTLYQQTDYQPGTSPRILTFAHKADLDAVLTDVKRMRAEVDIVVLYFHWGLHFVHGTIADYEKEVAHAVIDAGADLVLGSHPHMLKGIEVYKQRPIFYSMGNFAFDLPGWQIDEWFGKTPSRKQELKEYGWVYDDPEWVDYTFPPACRKSIIVKARIQDGRLAEVYFHPVRINQRAQPVSVTSADGEFTEILNYIREISRDQGFNTEFQVAGNRVLISGAEE